MWSRKPKIQRQSILTRRVRRPIIVNLSHSAFSMLLSSCSSSPRGLEIESEAGDGSRIALYAGPFTPFLVRGLAGPAPGSPAVIDLPSNLSRAVWIRQTGRSARWQWAVYECQAFERGRR